MEARADWHGAQELITSGWLSAHSQPVDAARPFSVDDPDEPTDLDPPRTDGGGAPSLRHSSGEPRGVKGRAPIDDDPTMLRPSLRPAQLARGSSAAPKLRGRVGKYELRGKLGRGAFGVVFTARDPSLDRDVAIKVLRPAHLSNPEIVQRFLLEARATARINHPGIVTIHDCGRVDTTAGETAYIAMELLAGESVTARLSRAGQLEPATAIEIARQVASALEAAHRADVLHRDLKPDNIYFVPDPAMPSGERVKVLDFGLAKLGDDGNTQTESIFGTPRYMAPEQCRSATLVDHRSDIYALGCVLYEMVTGRPLFDGDVRQVIECHVRETAPRARALAPALPLALDDLIASMLAKDPQQRPQTMAAVQRALVRIADRAQDRAREPSQALAAIAELADLRGVAAIPSLRASAPELSRMSGARPAMRASLPALRPALPAPLRVRPQGTTPPPPRPSTSRASTHPRPPTAGRSMEIDVSDVPSPRLAEASEPMRREAPPAAAVALATSLPSGILLVPANPALDAVPALRPAAQRWPYVVGALGLIAITAALTALVWLTFV